MTERLPFGSVRFVDAGYIAATAEAVGEAVSFPSFETGEANSFPYSFDLRAYQREGVAWLTRLAERNLGGILADEMGLGKTVQTLAFLLARRGGEPALIVCPTSLIANWRNEAQRFTPELRTLVLEGPDRHPRFVEIANHDVPLWTGDALYAVPHRIGQAERLGKTNAVVHRVVSSPSPRASVRSANASAVA